MEDEVEDGELVGSMFGVLKRDDSKSEERAKPMKLEKALKKVEKELAKQAQRTTSAGMQAALGDTRQGQDMISAALLASLQPGPVVESD
jgi:hypothetical protein